MRRAVIALLLMLATSPVSAEKLVTTLSTPNVEITSSFDGATLSLFGTIDADDPALAAKGPYNIIIVITGPLQDRVARLKTNRLGIWTNTEQVVFKQFPSFYGVLTSGALETIATPELLVEQDVTPEDQARTSAQSVGLKAERFGSELVRLMSEDGHLVFAESGVRFLSNTAYIAQLTLPSDVANGPFLAHTLVLKDKQLVAEDTQGFRVRKTGFESFVFVASRQQPLLYGLACVVLALGTGWLAGVAFKR